MANQYIAITIGPILKTMEMASSPAALWASSFMFSFISKRLRQSLIDRGVKRGDFITPYVDSEKEEKILNRRDGLGLLHDHIIFEKTDENGITIAALKEIRKAVLSETNDVFGIKNLPFLKQYVMIRAVEFKADNPIIGSGKMLDSLELAAPFISRETENELLKLFTNSGKKGKNEAIKQLGSDEVKNDSDDNEAAEGAKESPETDDVEAIGKFFEIDKKEWQLLNSEGNVRDLHAIASCDEKYHGLKKYHYYAVVRSDGDNMGKLIARLSTTEDFHTFSEACLTYCSNIAKKVKEYSGMTIYAGGDDLLALLPCDASGDGKKTIFHFLRDANQVFYDAFLKENEPIKKIFDRINDQIKKDDPKKAPLPEPSLTFGVTLCHWKYPLYEALADSANLLFGAKWKGYKNAVNLRLIKHSGQTSAVFMRNTVLGKTGEDSPFFKLFARIVSNANQEDADRAILSSLHSIREFEALFRLAGKDNAHDLFKNMFDADAHEGNDFLHKELPDLYVDYCLDADEAICALDDNGYKVRFPAKAPEPPQNDERPIDHPESLHYLLRILKFFVEKASEEKAGERE